MGMAAAWRVDGFPIRSIESSVQISLLSPSFQTSALPTGGANGYSGRDRNSASESANNQKPFESQRNIRNTIQIHLMVSLKHN